MKNLIFFVVFHLMSLCIYSLPSSFFSPQEIAMDNEITQTQFTNSPLFLVHPQMSDNQEKSASLAMLKSALLPGLGQFYVNKKSITAYIFPIIELGLWIIKADYQKKGDRDTAEFEKFANDHYDIRKQYMVQWHLMEYPNSGDFYSKGDGEWGNGGYFRLDNYYKNDRQQFYEAIGKYEKYVFGWADWFDTYVDYSVADWNYHIDNIYWIFNGETDPADIRWTGNRPIHDPSQIHYFDNKNFGSEYKTQYVKMRRSANQNYRKSDSINFAIVGNHMIAAIDANRMARKHNAQQGHTALIFPQINTVVIDNRPTPLIGVNVSF